MLAKPLILWSFLPQYLRLNFWGGQSKPMHWPLLSSVLCKLVLSSFTYWKLFSFFVVVVTIGTKGLKLAATWTIPSLTNCSHFWEIIRLHEIGAADYSINCEKCTGTVFCLSQFWFLKESTTVDSKISEIYFSQFWKLNVGNLRARMIEFWWESSRLQTADLLYPHVVERGQASSLSSFHNRGTNAFLGGSALMV
jgi:hypothetical protein